MPALQYDKQSRGALAYLALAGEFIRRNEGEKADITVLHDIHKVTG